MSMERDEGWDQGACKPRSGGSLEIGGPWMVDDMENRPGAFPTALLAVAQDALRIMRNENLLEPVAIWKIWPAKSSDPSGVVLCEGTRLPLQIYGDSSSGTKYLSFGLCGIGSAAETRISELFVSKQYRLALAIEEFVNRALFRLSEQLVATLRREARSLGLGLARPVSPGDGGLSLGYRKDVTRLAGGAEVGFSVTEAGMVRPGRALDFVAAIGAGIPKWHARRQCEKCPSQKRCSQGTARTNWGLADGQNGHAAGRL